MARERGVPLVVEANPVEGMPTLVAICDYDAGYDLGRWVGEHVASPQGQPLRVLDVALPTLRPCLLRSEGFLDGLREIQPDAALVARVNGEGSPVVARREAGKAFAGHGQVDVIFAMDDETGQGAFEAYRDAGLDPDAVTLAGFGLAGDHEKDWLMSGGALKASAAMFPEYVAVRCVDGLMRLASGEPVERRDVIPTVPMTPDLLARFYPKVGGAWTPDFRAIAALPARGACTRE
jgi:ribose transport system substrate-binding protein